jgi:hypothetical protein
MAHSGSQYKFDPSGRPRAPYREKRLSDLMEVKESASLGFAAPHASPLASEELSRNKRGMGCLPTPAEAMARLVRMYARKVRSEARWSRATLPEFSSRNETESYTVNIEEKKDKTPDCGGTSSSSQIAYSS